MRRLLHLLVLLLGLAFIAAEPASAAAALHDENPASGSATIVENLVEQNARLSGEGVNEIPAIVYDLASDFPVAARGVATVAARANVSLARSIEAGLVRPGGKLAEVLGGIERGVAAAQPRTALEAAGVVQRAATQAGLDVGVASVGSGGQIILKNVGGVVTTLGSDGSIVVTRGADLLLGLGL